MADILVIEDDPVLVERIESSLARLGYSVESRTDGESGLRTALEGSYGLILLDLMLPGRDGWSICREIRANGLETPILMLTARGEVEDRVQGLEIGADDYLPKPFDFRELKARVQAMLRRSGRAKGTERYEVGTLVVDSDAHRAARGQTELHLTKLEFELLRALAANAGRAMSREVLEDALWPGEEVFSNALSFHVRSLRKKLSPNGEPEMIHTVHGVGYVLEDRS
jgi:DNA-binding response OmpR family regulator